MRVRSLLSASAMIVTLACTLAASASADVGGAQTFVEKEHGQLRKLVDGKAPQDQVRQAIDGMVDYEELAKRTLGKPCPAGVTQCKNHWDLDLNPDQQREITNLLRQLVEKNYRKNLDKTKSYDITYRGAKDQGESLTKVRTEAKNKEKPRDPAYLVDYMIVERGAQYRVVDIVTEGSSMTKNYYDQFHRMLTTPGQGYPYMLQKLKDKVATKPADK